MFSVPKSIQNKWYVKVNCLGINQSDYKTNKPLEEKVEEGNAVYATCGLQIQEFGFI